MEQNRSLAAHGIHRIFNRFSITQSKSGSLTVIVTPCSGNPDRSALYRKSAFPYNLTIGGQPRANLPAGDPWRNRSSRNAGQSSPSDARPCRFRTIERDRYLQLQNSIHATNDEIGVPNWCAVSLDNPTHTRFCCAFNELRRAKNTSAMKMLSPPAAHRENLQLLERVGIIVIKRLIEFGEFNGISFLENASIFF